MKKNTNFIRGLIGIVLLLIAAPMAADNYLTLDQLKEQYKQLIRPRPSNSSDPLLNALVQIEPEKEVDDQVVEEVMLLYPFSAERIRKNLANIADDGSWSDINYNDMDLSGWQPQNHLRRTLEFARLLNSPEKNQYDVERLKKAIHLALQYWFRERPMSENQWYNQIGAPKLLGEIMLLSENVLSRQELASGIRLIKAQKPVTNVQGKVLMAGNILMCGLLEGNANLVKAARDTIAAQIAMGKSEGIKSDWSFHQRGSQLQFGGNGLSFITRMGFYKRLFQNSPLAFSPAQNQILSSLVDEGFQWIIWRRYMDVNALGRQLFKNVQLHKGFYLALIAKGIGTSTFPAYGNALIGHKFFYESDYSVHRTADWMASLKMSSDKVEGTESLNKDNLKGFFLSDGATFFYTRGDEYNNIFPFWDWRKIPGVTAHEDIRKIPNKQFVVQKNKTNKVGGISYETDGFSAMELNRGGLRAYKSWFFTDKYVLCLGSGITSDSSLCVTTSINQCLKKGPLVYRTGKRWKQVENQQYIEGKNLRFFHDNTGYIVVNKSSCIAKDEHRIGRWHDVMGMYKPEDVEADVVSLHLNHGAAPEDASYAYLVFPASNPKEIESFNLSDIEIIKNDSQAQVIRQPDKKDIYWIAVYEPVRLNIKKQSLSIYKPGVYCMLFKDKRFTPLKSYEF